MLSEYVIALPYWCAQEVDNFLQVLSQWENFCQTSVPYQFLIARRFDTKPDPRLSDACSKYAPTEEISCDAYPWLGYPAGANGMFKSVMEHAAEKHGATGGFVFWFEHDVIPIHADWLTHLADWWSERYLFMGQFVPQEWINENGVQRQYKPYFSGSACFNKHFTQSPLFDDIHEQHAFDSYVSGRLQEVDHVVHPIPHMFDLFFFMPPWSKCCNLNKLMVNGAKNFDQRRHLIKYILENRA
jgi:hypothetical protein